MKQDNQFFNEVERPFAWIDFNALDFNIQFVNEACGPKRVRIATKSVRSVELLKYIAKRINHLAGFMTFTAAETVYLLEQGLDHFLIGYPVMEETSIKRLLHFIGQDKDVTFMVDDVIQAQMLSRLALKADASVKVCIDLNVSTDFKWLYFGTKRSPIGSIKALDDLLQQLKQLPAIEVTAVMGYDAQLAGVADHSVGAASGKSVLIRQLKKISAQKITQFRQFAVAHVRAYTDLEIINAGGSGSMQYSSKQREVTEITVGSAFFAPALFDGYDNLQLEPATGFALRVTRKFAADTVVGHGGGYIASGAVGKDRLPQFLQKERYRYLPLEGAGEVQTPIQVLQGAHQIGDTIYFRHAKAGELCERFLVLHAVKNQRYIGPIQTYRGDGQCFL